MHRSLQLLSAFTIHLYSQAFQVLLQTGRSKLLAKFKGRNVLKIYRVRFKLASDQMHQLSYRTK